MKALFISILLAAAGLANTGGDTPFSGKWQIHLKISDREADETCTFIQNGGEVTGSCTSERGTGSISGKVEDKKITWKYKSESKDNGTITLNYRGALKSATEIAGFVNVEEYGVEGEFTATQSN